VVGGVAFGVAFGVVSGIVGGFAGGVAFNVGAFAVAFCIAWAVASGVVGGLASGVAWAVASGVVGGLAFGIVAFGFSFGVVGGLVGAVASGVVGGLGWALVFGVMGGLAWIVAFGMAISIFVLRLENWLIGLLFNANFFFNRSFFYSRATSLPLPYFSFKIQQWLRQDWETGVYNLDQLLQYSLQFIPVVRAVNRVLSEFPSEQVIYKVSQLAENPYDWNLLRFASEPLAQKLKYEGVRGFFSFLLFNFFSRWRDNLLSRFDSEPRLDTPSRAAAAGFWYLHEQRSYQAVKAFSVVRTILYGEEMHTLANTLNQFTEAQSLDTITSLKLSPIPPEPQLRPITWNAIKSLNQVIEDLRLVKSGYSRQARSLALNRVIGTPRYFRSSVCHTPTSRKRTDSRYR
jgi:hypothetical protein